MSDFYDLVPAGVSGDWSVVKDDANRTIQLVRQWRGQRLIYMANSCWETGLHEPFIRAARGRVLIVGLGLGYDVWAVRDKAGVAAVDVVETEADVITLVTEHMAHPKVTVIHDRASAYLGATESRYDVIWFDIYCQDPSVHEAATERLTALAEAVLAPGGEVLFWRTLPALEI